MGFLGVDGIERGLSLLITVGLEHMSFKGPFNPNYSMILLEKTTSCLAPEAELR